jgi:hypothetical protein
MSGEIDPSAWLTVEEAAILAGRAKRTVWEWVQQGVLPSRLGGDGNIIHVQYGKLMAVKKSRRNGRPLGTPTRR